MSPKLLNILLVLIPVALYYGYIDPYYSGEPGLIWSPEQGIISLQNENVQYANTLNQTGVIKDAAAKLNKDYADFDEKVKTQIFTMVPDTLDAVKLRNEVIVIAAKSGLAVEGLKVEKDIKGDKGIKFYRVGFSVKTKYSKFKELMESYERSRRFFTIEQATIRHPTLDDTKEKKEIQDDVLNFVVTFRVYYLK